MELLAVLLLVVVAILWLLLARRDRQIRDLKRQIEPLLPFQQIVDAERRAAEIMSKANEEATVLGIEVKREVDNARREASDDVSRLMEQAQREMDTAKTEAEKMVGHARVEASRLLDAANEEAKTIAGAAWDAAQRAGELEKVVAAMKNVIEGYGDQYIIPAHSL